MTNLTPEQQARQQIDTMLAAAGWEVQPHRAMQLRRSRGVAVCEFPLTNGFADYLLFVDRRPIGVIEAKAAGVPLSGAEPQAARYCAGLPEDRRNLGQQALNEFQQYTTPDTGRKFTELYNVQHMRTNVLDPELEECAMAEMTGVFGDQPREVTYNPALPPEYFDVIIIIIIDEYYRSIYN